MPRSKWPEHTRMNAMRSRCAGSMLAWILNTKPENFGSAGCTARTWRRARAAAAPVDAARPEFRCTPKLLMAEPKNTGVCCRRGTASQIEGDARRRAPARTSFAQLLACSRRNVARQRGLSMPLMTSNSCRPCLARREQHASRRAAGDTRRGSALPMPIGQVTGAHWMLQHRLDFVQQFERLAALRGPSC